MSKNNQRAPAPVVPCDVKDCKTAWSIVVNVREGGTVKHSVKLCAPHYQEFQAGKSPTLRG